VRDLLGKLFSGQNGSNRSESPLNSHSRTDTGIEAEQNDVEAGGEDENTIEQTIEMMPVEVVVTPVGESSAAVSGAESQVTEDERVKTSPLAPTALDTLTGISKRTNSRNDGRPTLQAAHCSHLGNRRTRNEDSTFMFTAASGGQEPLIPFGLYVVADGMGGHHAGHEASRSVSWLVASTVLERIYLPMLESSMSKRIRQQEPILEVLVDAVQNANLQIYNPEPGKDSGTTVTTGLLLGQRLFIAHVGDSRAYILIDDELSLLTTDHSYVQRLQDAGQLTEEEAAVHPQRNMLYKAVGQGGLLDIDTFTRSLPGSGMLVLCSDGLWGLVDDSQIQEVITSDVSLMKMTDKLVNMALEAGGHDNISVVLVEFSF